MFERVAHIFQISLSDGFRCSLHHNFASQRRGERTWVRGSVAIFTYILWYTLKKSGFLFDVPVGEIATQTRKERRTAFTRPLSSAARLGRKPRAQPQSVHNLSSILLAGYEGTERQGEKSPPTLDLCHAKFRLHLQCTPPSPQIQKQ